MRSGSSRRFHRIPDSGSFLRGYPESQQRQLLAPCPWRSRRAASTQPRRAGAPRPSPVARRPSPVGHAKRGHAEHEPSPSARQAAKRSGHAVGSLGPVKRSPAGHAEHKRRGPRYAQDATQGAQRAFFDRFLAPGKVMVACVVDVSHATALCDLGSARRANRCPAGRRLHQGPDCCGELAESGGLCSALTRQRSLPTTTGTRERQQ